MPVGHANIKINGGMPQGAEQRIADALMNNPDLVASLAQNVLGAAGAQGSVTASGGGHSSLDINIHTDQPAATQAPAQTVQSDAQIAMNAAADRMASTMQQISDLLGQSFMESDRAKQWSAETASIRKGEDDYYVPAYGGKAAHHVNQDDADKLLLAAQHRDNFADWITDSLKEIRGTAETGGLSWGKKFQQRYEELQQEAARAEALYREGNSTQATSRMYGVMQEQESFKSRINRHLRESQDISYNDANKLYRQQRAAKPPAQERMRERQEEQREKREEQVQQPKKDAVVETKGDVHVNSKKAPVLEGQDNGATQPKKAAQTDKSFERTVENLERNTRGPSGGGPGGPGGGGPSGGGPGGGGPGGPGGGAPGGGGPGGGGPGGGGGGEPILPKSEIRHFVKQQDLDAYLNGEGLHEVANSIKTNLTQLKSTASDITATYQNGTLTGVSLKAKHVDFGDIEMAQMKYRIGTEPEDPNDPNNKHHRYKDKVDAEIVRTAGSQEKMNKLDEKIGKETAAAASEFNAWMQHSALQSKDASGHNNRQDQLLSYLGEQVDDKGTKQFGYVDDQGVVHLGHRNAEGNLEKLKLTELQEVQNNLATFRGEMSQLNRTMRQDFAQNGIDTIDQKYNKALTERSVLAGRLSAMGYETEPGKVSLARLRNGESVNALFKEIDAAAGAYRQHSGNVDEQVKDYNRLRSAIEQTQNAVNTENTARSAGTKLTREAIQTENKLAAAEKALNEKNADLQTDKVTALRQSMDALTSAKQPENRLRALDDITHKTQELSAATKAYNDQQARMERTGLKLDSMRDRLGAVGANQPLSMTKAAQALNYYNQSKDVKKQNEWAEKVDEYMKTAQRDVGRTISSTRATQKQDAAVNAAQEQTQQLLKDATARFGADRQEVKALSDASKRLAETGSDRYQTRQNRLTAMEKAAEPVGDLLKAFGKNAKAAEQQYNQLIGRDAFKGLSKEDRDRLTGAYDAYKNGGKAGTQESLTALQDAIKSTKSMADKAAESYRTGPLSDKIAQKEKQLSEYTQRQEAGKLTGDQSTLLQNAQGFMKQAKDLLESGDVSGARSMFGRAGTWMSQLSDSLKASDQAQGKYDALKAQMAERDRVLTGLHNQFTKEKIGQPESLTAARQAMGNFKRSMDPQTMEKYAKEVEANFKQVKDDSAAALKFGRQVQVQDKQVAAAKQRAEELLTDPRLAAGRKDTAALQTALNGMISANGSSPANTYSRREGALGKLEEAIKPVSAALEKFEKDAAAADKQYKALTEESMFKGLTGKQQMAVGDAYKAFQGARTESNLQKLQESMSAARDLIGLHETANQSTALREKTGKAQDQLNAVQSRAGGTEKWTEFQKQMYENATGYLRTANDQLGVGNFDQASASLSHFNTSMQRLTMSLTQSEQAANQAANAQKKKADEEARAAADEARARDRAAVATAKTQQDAEKNKYYGGLNDSMKTAMQNAQGAYAASGSQKDLEAWQKSVSKVQWREMAAELQDYNKQVELLRNPTGAAGRDDSTKWAAAQQEQLNNWLQSRSEFSQAYAKGDMGGARAALDRLSEEKDTMAAQVKAYQDMQAAVEKAQGNKNYGRASDELKTNLQSAMEALNGASADQFTEKLNAAREALTALNGAMEAQKGNDYWERQEASLAQYEARLNRLGSKGKGYDSWTDSQKQMYDQAKDNLRAMRDAMPNEKRGKEGDAGAFEAAQRTGSKQMSALSASFASANGNLTGMVGNVDALSRYLMNMTAPMMMWRRFSSYIKKTMSRVAAIDSQMADLRKVTNNTSAEYQQFLETTGQNAVSVGAKISDLVATTSTFAHMGYNLTDSQALGVTATKFANVGNFQNTTAAADSMIAVIKGFDDLDIKDADLVGDKLTAVANNYAVTANDIAEGLQKSASSLNVAGNNVDQSTAMITAIAEVTRDAGAAGSALKVLSMRIRGAKTEISDAGESTEGMAESTSKLRAKVKALTNVDGKGGVDILADEDTFRSTYDIMSDISQVWGQMSDIDQSALLELLAGKVRSNQVAALLSNFDQAESALKTSQNAEGTMDKVHKAWMDSVEARKAQFEAAQETLAMTAMPASSLSSLYQLGTSALQFLNWGMGFTGSGGMGAGLLGVAGALHSGNGDILQGLGNMFGMHRDPISGKMTKGNAEWVQAYNQEYNLSHDRTDAYNKATEAVLENNEALDGYTQSLYDHVDGAIDMSEVTGGLGAAAKSFAKNMLVGIGTFAALELSMAALNKGLEWIDSEILHKGETLSNRAATAHADAEAAQKEASDVRAERETAQSRISELETKSGSQGLSSDEEAELIDLRSQVRILEYRQSLADNKAKIAAQKGVESWLTSYQYSKAHQHGEGALAYSQAEGAEAHAIFAQAYNDAMNKLMEIDQEFNNVQEGSPEYEQLEQEYDAVWSDVKQLEDLQYKSFAISSENMEDPSIRALVSRNLKQSQPLPENFRDRFTNAVTSRSEELGKRQNLTPNIARIQALSENLDKLFDDILNGDLDPQTLIQAAQYAQEQYNELVDNTLATNGEAAKQLHDVSAFTGINEKNDQVQAHISTVLQDMQDSVVARTQDYLAAGGDVSDEAKGAMTQLFQDYMDLFDYQFPGSQYDAVRSLLSETSLSDVVTELDKLATQTEVTGQSLENLNVDGVENAGSKLIGLLNLMGISVDDFVSWVNQSTADSRTPTDENAAKRNTYADRRAAVDSVVAAQDAGAKVWSSTGFTGAMSQEEYKSLADLGDESYMAAVEYANGGLFFNKDAFDAIVQKKYQEELKGLQSDVVRETEKFNKAAQSIFQKYGAGETDTQEFSTDLESLITSGGNLAGFRRMGAQIAYATGEYANWMNNKGGAESDTMLNELSTAANLISETKKTGRYGTREYAAALQFYSGQEGFMTDMLTAGDQETLALLRSISNPDSASSKEELQTARNSVSALQKRMQQAGVLDENFVVNDGLDADQIAQMYNKEFGANLGAGGVISMFSAFNAYIEDEAKKYHIGESPMTGMPPEVLEAQENLTKAVADFKADRTDENWAKVQAAAEAYTKTTNDAKLEKMLASGNTAGAVKAIEESSVAGGMQDAADAASSLVSSFEGLESAVANLKKTITGEGEGETGESDSGTETENTPQFSFQSFEDVMGAMDELHSASMQFEDQYYGQLTEDQKSTLEKIQAAATSEYATQAEAEKAYSEARQWMSGLQDELAGYASPTQPEETPSSPKEQTIEASNELSQAQAAVYDKEPDAVDEVAQEQLAEAHRLAEEGAALANAHPNLNRALAALANAGKEEAGTDNYGELLASAEVALQEAKVEPAMDFPSLNERFNDLVSQYPQYEEGLAEQRDALATMLTNGEAGTIEYDTAATEFASALRDAENQAQAYEADLAAQQQLAEAHRLAKEGASLAKDYPTLGKALAQLASLDDGEAGTANYGEVLASAQLEFQEARDDINEQATQALEQSGVQAAEMGNPGLYQAQLLLQQAMGGNSDLQTLKDRTQALKFETARKKARDSLENFGAEMSDFVQENPGFNSEELANQRDALWAMFENDEFENDDFWETFAGLEDSLASAKKQEAYKQANQLISQADEILQEYDDADLSKAADEARALIDSGAEANDDFWNVIGALEESMALAGKRQEIDELHQNIEEWDTVPDTRGTLGYHARTDEQSELMSRLLSLSQYDPWDTAESLDQKIAEATKKFAELKQSTADAEQQEGGALLAQIEEFLDSSDSEHPELIDAAAELRTAMTEYATGEKDSVRVETDWAREQFDAAKRRIVSERGQQNAAEAHRLLKEAQEYLLDHPDNEELALATHALEQLDDETAVTGDYQEVVASAEEELRDAYFRDAEQALADSQAETDGLTNPDLYQAQVQLQQALGGNADLYELKAQAATVRRETKRKKAYDSLTAFSEEMGGFIEENPGFDSEELGKQRDALWEMFENGEFENDDFWETFAGLEDSLASAKKQEAYKQAHQLISQADEILQDYDDADLSKAVDEAQALIDSGAEANDDFWNVIGALEESMSLAGKRKEIDELHDDIEEWDIVPDTNGTPGYHVKTDEQSELMSDILVLSRYNPSDDVETLQSKIAEVKKKFAELQKSTAESEQQEGSALLADIEEFLGSSGSEYPVLNEAASDLRTALAEYTMGGKDNVRTEIDWAREQFEAATKQVADEGARQQASEKHRLMKEAQSYLLDHPDNEGLALATNALGQLDDETAGTGDYEEVVAAAEEELLAAYSKDAEQALADSQAEAGDGLDPELASLYLAQEQLVRAMQNPQLQELKDRTRQLEHETARKQARDSLENLSKEMHDLFQEYPGLDSEELENSRDALWEMFENGEFENDDFWEAFTDLEGSLTDTREQEGRRAKQEAEQKAQGGVKQNVSLQRKKAQAMLDEMLASGEWADMYDEFETLSNAMTDESVTDEMLSAMMNDIEQQRAQKQEDALQAISDVKEEAEQADGLATDVENADNIAQQREKAQAMLDEMLASGEWADMYDEFQALSNAVKDESVTSEMLGAMMNDIEQQRAQKQDDALQAIAEVKEEAEQAAGLTADVENAGDIEQQRKKAQAMLDEMLASGEWADMYEAYEALSNAVKDESITSEMLGAMMSDIEQQRADKRGPELEAPAEEPPAAPKQQPPRKKNVTGSAKLVEPQRRHYNPVAAMTSFRSAMRNGVDDGHLTQEEYDEWNRRLSSTVGTDAFADAVNEWDTFMTFQYGYTDSGGYKWLSMPGSALRYLGGRAELPLEKMSPEQYRAYEKYRSKVTAPDTTYFDMFNDDTLDGLFDGWSSAENMKIDLLDAVSNGVISQQKYDQYMSEIDAAYENGDLWEVVYRINDELPDGYQWEGKALPPNTIRANGTQPPEGAMLWAGAGASDAGFGRKNVWTGNGLEITTASVDINGGAHSFDEVGAYMTDLLASGVSTIEDVMKYDNPANGGLGVVTGAVQTGNGAGGASVQAGQNVASVSIPSKIEQPEPIDVPTPEEVTIPVEADTSQAQSQISSVSGKTVTIQAVADVSGAQADIDSVSADDKKYSFSAAAEGTESANGGTYLVDELGAELIEHRSQGTYELGTNGGARFTKLNPGDIVHTARETKKILSRGRAMWGGGVVTGRAAAGEPVNGGGGNIGYTYDPDAERRKAMEEAEKAAEAAANAFDLSDHKAKRLLNWIKKILDWIPTYLNILKKKTAEFVSAADDAVHYLSQNKLIDDAINNVAEEIQANVAAVLRYRSFLKEIQVQGGLTDEDIYLVQHGAIDLTRYGDENSIKAIQTYQQYWEKLVACQESLAALNDQMETLSKQKLDNIVSYFDRIDGLLQDQKKKFESLLDLKKQYGQELTGEDYMDSLTNMEQILANAKSEEAALLKELEDQLGVNGDIVQAILNGGKNVWEAIAAHVKKGVDEGIDDLKSGLEGNITTKTEAHLNGVPEWYRGLNEHEVETMDARVYAEAETKTETNTETPGNNPSINVNIGANVPAAQREAILKSLSKVKTTSGNLNNYYLEKKLESERERLEKEAKDVALPTVPVNPIEAPVEPATEEDLKAIGEMLGLNVADGSEEALANLETIKSLLTTSWDNPLAIGSETWYSFMSTLEGLKESIISTEIEISEMNDEIADIPLNNLKTGYDYLEEIKKNLEGVNELLDAQGSSKYPDTYRSLISVGMEQIDNLKEQNKLIEAQMSSLDPLSEKYQELRDDLTNNLDTISDIRKSQEEWNDAIIDLQIDRLRKQNDKYKEQLSLMHALDDLENARQRKILVYHDEGGFRYEADEDELEAAQESANDAIYNSLINRLEEAKENNNIYGPLGERLIEGSSIVDSLGNTLVPVEDMLSGIDFEPYYRSIVEGAEMSGLLTSMLNSIDMTKLLESSIGGNVSIDLSGMTLNEVSDVKELCDAIMQQLPNFLLQAMYQKGAN